MPSTYNSIYSYAFSFYLYSIHLQNTSHLFIQTKVKRLIAFAKEKYNKNNYQLYALKTTNLFRYFTFRDFVRENI